MARAGKNHKGGRPKGSKGTHTLQAEIAKQQLIKAYIANIKPINQALIKKAKQGDIQAIRELHDRVYGKSLQPMEGNFTSELKISFDDSLKHKFSIPS